MNGKKGYDQIMLAEGIEVSTDCAVTNINNNICVVGGSGSGKTFSVVIPRILAAYYSNLIVITTKDRLCDMSRRMLERRGYKVLKLDFSHPEKSTCYWNPLSDLDSWQALIKLATDIVLSNKKRGETTNADPYWIEVAISLLAALMGYVICTNDKGTFFLVVELFHQLKVIVNGNGNDVVETTLDDKFEHFEEICGMDHFVVQAWHTARDLPVKTLQCVIGTLASAIDKVFSSDVLKNLSPAEGKEKLIMSDFAHKKIVLFLNTSPVNVNLYYLVNMFYANAFASLFECAESTGGTLEIPTHIICDDFACGGAVNNFQEYVSVFRQAGISTTILLQSESQLEDIYGDCGSRIIIDNMDTYIFMGSNDRISCRNMGERIDRPLSEVMNMPVGKEIILRRGEKPKIFVDRYKTFEDQRYQELELECDRKKRNAVKRKLARLVTGR